MAARESIIRRFYSLQTSSLLPSFLFHFARFHLLCVVEMLRLVCGKKYGGVVVVRLHHSLHANFDKRGKLRENCDRAKRFLQGSCFFFFFFYVTVQVLLTRSLTLRETLTFSNLRLILG